MPVYTITCNIQQIRESKNLSRQKLATLAGVSISGLADIEKNRKIPSVYNAYLLAEALDVPIEQLFTFAPPD